MYVCMYVFISSSFLSLPQSPKANNHKNKKNIPFSKTLPAARHPLEAKGPEANPYVFSEAGSQGCPEILMELLILGFRGLGYR